VKRVRIYVNGEAKVVRWRTHTEEETLEVLGLPAGTRVALSYARECFLDFSKGWGFADGHHYVSEEGDPDEVHEQQPWQIDADAWKG